MNRGESHNKKLYQAAFSPLHTSCNFDLEETKMKKTGTGFRCRRSIVVFAAVLSVLMAMSAVAYAVTGGQIIENMKVFIGGKQVDSAVVKSEDGKSYRIDVREEADGSASFDIKKDDGSPADIETDAPAEFDIQQ